MRRSKAVACFAVVAPALLALYAFGSGEPRHGWKSLSAWAHEYHINGSREAREAIRAIGTNAIPVLLSELEAGPSPLLVKAKPLLIKLRPEFVQKRYETIWERRDAAAFAFTALGSTAVPAVPELISLLGKNNRAEMALASIGQAAVPALRQVTQSPSLARRFCAIRVLGEMPHEAALPPLFEAAGAANPSTRFAAVQALIRQRQFAPIIIPALVARIEDSDPLVRSRAIYALGALGRSAAEALPLLREMEAGSDPVHAGEVRLSIQRIEGTLPPPRRFERLALPQID